MTIIEAHKKKASPGEGAGDLGEGAGDLEQYADRCFCRRRLRRRW